MAWTEEIVADTKAWYVEGLSCSQIAAEIGLKYHVSFTRNAVIGKLHRNGMTGGGCQPGPRKDGQAKPRKRGRTRFYPKAVPAQRLGEQQYCSEPEAVDTDLPSDSSSFACTLLDLTSTTCRWPIGDPPTPEFHFCGAPTSADVNCPYCQRHADIAYQGNERRETQAQTAWRMQQKRRAEVKKFAA